MRFVYAIIAFLLGLVLLGLGITQLTAEREETFTVETEGAQEAPFMVITDDVIDDEEGRDEFTIEAEGEYQIAQGRTYDVEAWLDDAAHNRITGYEASEDAEEPSRFVADFIDGETDVPDPSNSDLWVSVETAEGSAPYRWATPDEAGDWALLIFREDGEAAPSSITTTETVTRSATEGIALTVGGALVILLSLVLFYRALSAPRRKQKKSATAVAAASATSAKTEASESPKADAEEPAESSAGWSIPSVEAAAEADPDAPTEVVPAYTDDEAEPEVEAEAVDDAEAEAADESAEAQSDSADDNAAEDEATETHERSGAEEPVADEDQPTEVVPAYSDQEDSAAAGQGEDNTDEDNTDEDQRSDGEQDDDEDDDSMTPPQADLGAESDPAKKVSRWTDRFRKRLDDGRSPFAVVLAMLVALASGFGLAGPAHADSDADSDEQDQAEESDSSADEDAEDNDDADDATENDDADDEAAEDDEDAETSDQEDGTSENDATEDDAADETAEDEDVLEGGLDDDGDQAAEPEVEGEMPSEGYSVLLTSQLESILEDIAETVAAGDEEQDSEQLESRVDGPALDLREHAYRNYDLAETELPTPIGTEVLSAAVSGDPDFPRQAVVIVEHPDTDVPQFLVLEQASARENYKLVNTAMMAPGTEFSAYSTEQGGISVLEPGDSDDENSPAAYLDGIANWFADDEHEFGEQMAESVYIEALHEYHADLGEAAEDTDIEVPSPEVDDEQIFAIELPDGSRVVSGVFEMTLEMSPISDGDTIFLDNDLVEGILGTDWTTFPTQIISQEYVVAQIPPEDSEEEIVLLGVDNLVTDANIDTPDWFDGY